jgi:hypothetical protein
MKLTVEEAQKAAQKFVMDHISTKPLGLPELDEASFGAVMDAIVKAMVMAWADGYYTRDGAR